jgi:uncharacterized membrane protein
MSFVDVMEHVAQVFEGIGAAVLLGGLIVSAGVAASSWRRDRDLRAAYVTMRGSFGSVILLGLEILVAADLVRTVAVAPSVENVLVLGLIVLIRTFLSFSLEIEIEGVVPWRRGPAQGRSTTGIGKPSRLRLHRVPADGNRVATPSARRTGFHG